MKIIIKFCQINNWDKDVNRIKGGKKVPEGFTYSSDNNSDWMTENDFKLWLTSNIEGFSFQK